MAKEEKQLLHIAMFLQQLSAHMILYSWPPMELHIHPKTPSPHLAPLVGFANLPFPREFERILGYSLERGNPYRYTGQPPKLDTIAEVLKIDIRELASTKEEKGAIHGFSRKYLEQKCQDLADKKEWSTFIDVLALIIYGIVIFPNLDNFVDFAAINVFLAFNKHKQNPVPAVLADVYYSMHMRHEKKGGTILCCVPVLYTWFVSHMFKKGYHVGVKSNREWAQGIASLTGDKISWYYREQEVEEDETIYWEERFMVLLGQLKNQEIYKELEDKGKHWKDCFSKLAMLANQIKAIEGYNVYGLEAFDMCLVPDVTIPAKFKVPDFEKYKGNTCPKNHLTMYCRKMASHAHNDKLLIHFFQDSLSGASLSWYMHLERNQIRSWKDLADAFLKQYRYNVDMAPDRMQLQNSLKNDNEAFKEYAQRWREMASQVEPPLSEREMVGMFMDTLPSPFFDKMIGSMSSNFSDLVMIGERIESGMRSGKIVCAATSVKRPQTTFTKKKEGDTNAVMVNPRISYFPPINSYEDNPNIGSNPLPGHGNASVNFIEDGIYQYVIDDHQPSDGCEPKGTKVTNISGISGMTQSGRVYTPEQLRKKEEASEFLKFVKQSEYKVVDQLNQTPSKISVLSLLLNSEAHRRALMKVLNEAHVTHDITVDQFDGVVGNITASSCLSFGDNELPAEGTEHNKTLHISMRCHDHILARVLVDNGSSLNVMPKSTLSKLFVEGACLKPSALVVKAFDGSRRQVIGEIDLPIQIGPHIFGITFQVMDIKPAYSCLLGRPWIHAAGAVTSTLHQKLKFTVNNKLVIIYGEEDMIVSHLSSTGYIEDTEEAIETFFQALEIANVVFMGEGYRLKEPKQSTISLKSTKSMLEGGVFLNLGKLIEIPEKNNRYGLGYVPTQADEEKAAKEKRENKVTRRENWIPNSQKIPICDIRQNFQSAGIIYADQVAVAEEDHGDDDTLKLVYPCPPNTNLNNWKIIEFEDCEDDCELPPELESLIEREAKIIQPYQEPVEAINLGTGHDKKEVKVGMSMKESEREKLVKLLIDYVDVFAWSYQDMPGLDTNIVEHKLPLKPEYTPIKQKLRRMRPDMSLKIREEVKKQFDAGFLAVAKYPQWVANIVPVPKKDGKVRMCVDYRDLNKASPKDDFPLPHIDVLVDSTAQYSLFSFMDGFSGYNQIKMAPEDMEKTTFITQWGTFCYKVMPFGLKNAGATYQRAMVTLFHDMMHKEIEVYVDDMIAKSRTEEDHVVNLQKLFERLRKFKLRLNPAKCTFGVRSGKLLGFIVSQKGIEVDPDKVRAIQEMPAPRTEKEVRGFLGRLNYIARFISHLTATCEPIFKLLRKDQKVEWNENCQKAFEKIKQYLSKPPILVPPVPGKPLIMYLTVLDESMGCVLGQHDESGRKEHAIYYLSKKFTSCETRYSLLERTCCALAWAARRLRQYMLCHTTWLVSKMDPIKYIFEKPALTGRIARWQMLLSEYDLVYVTQKSIKGSALAEYLAHQPVEDYQSMQCEFPDEDIMNLVEEIESSDKEKWRLVFDGASNALGHGIGAILISPENQFTPFTARLCFDCTNNIAEYEACVMGIKAAIESNVKFLEVYGDSLLVIHQTKGDWETRDSKLIPYHTHIKELTEQFEKITFHHIPREENQLADALATLSSMFKITTNQDVPVIKIQQRDKPAYCLSIEEELDGKPWFYDIKSYVKNKEYPLGISENDKRVLRRLSMNFFLNGDVLYKRNHDMVLLRCVDKAEAGKIIQEVHEGSFGTHANGHTMARKILRAGYYWLTMESDCFSHVKKCHKCQIYADKIHVPPTSLNVLTSPWPFSMWGMDVIGLIEPKASNGHRFILVAIDYFTKWVEAASYANVTRSVVVRFIKRELICRYGLPNKIITDNATNLNNKMMKELCDNFKIQHHNSSPYRPKMNGAVEAANKNIKKIIQKMVETYKDWHEMLPFALHGYRTSVRTSTGATPFSLVYGMEAVLPIEVEIPSIKVLMETKLEEAEWVQSRYDQLNLIEEKRMIALCHGQLYQKRLKKAYEKKVRPREFREGELVLKKILPIKKDSRGKWTPNYEGPYVVKKAFSGGALILAEMDGDELPLPVNSDAVKKYYA
uniref:RNA-directed DNA polymerase n=1 Tax=Cicer arietinum TaxID=3827 RepID=A0A3Q7XQ08_CICAR|nr:uncharacterized protein LOC113786262 [Cicer arietinum]